MNKENFNFSEILSKIELIKSKLINSYNLTSEDISKDYTYILNSFHLVDNDKIDILYSELRKIILINPKIFKNFKLKKLNNISISILKNEKDKVLKQTWYYIHKKSVFNVKIFDSCIEENIIKFKCAWLVFLYEKNDISKINNTKFYLENKINGKRVELKVNWGEKSYYKYDYPHEKLLNNKDNFYLIINLNTLAEGEYRICYEFLGEEGQAVISNAAVSRKLKSIFTRDKEELKLIRFRTSYRQIYINVKIKNKNPMNFIKLKLYNLNFDFKLIKRLKRDKLKLYFIYVFYNLIKLLYKKKIVLLGELPNSYEDSSSVLFDYLRKNKQKFKYYYVTTKTELIKSDSRFIKFGGFKHKLLFLLADVVANVQNIDLYMNPFMSRDENYVAKKEAEDTLLYLAFSKYLSNQKRIFLQHGVLYQSGLTNAIYVNSDFDYLVVSTDFEKKVFPSRGREFLECCLPRFSRYDSNKLYERKILFSPTWRKYLKNINTGNVDIDVVRESEYYKRIIEVITSNEVNNILKKYNYTMIYNVHHTLKSIIEEDLRYIELPSNILIKKDNESLNDLINESSICITDYSSLFFDFLWQGKKVINYIFDYNDFHTRKDNNKKLNNYFDIKSFPWTVYTDDYFELLDILKKSLEDDKNYNNYLRKKIFFNIENPCESIKNIIENM